MRGLGGGCVRGAVREQIRIRVLPPTAPYLLEQDYVYGPDYVDEFVAQIDNAGATLYMLQDAEFNVVALTDTAGAVLAQYSYEPYGNVLNADELAAAPPISRVGHQGLFFDRFNSLLEDPPPLDRDANGLYHARNRSCNPLLGRFMQRDPNETGQLVITEP